MKGYNPCDMKKCELIAYMEKYTIVQAAKQINIGPTTLKKVCRKYGFKRWNYREYNSEYNVVRKVFNKDMLIQIMNQYTQSEATQSYNLTKHTFNKLCRDYDLRPWKKGKFLNVLHGVRNDDLQLPSLPSLKVDEYITKQILDEKFIKEALNSSGIESCSENDVFLHVPEYVLRYDGNKEYLVPNEDY